MGLISDADWSAFEEAVNSTKDDFHTKQVIWRRAKRVIDRFGEGEENQYDEFGFGVLCNYNFMRSWPVTLHTGNGALDRQSIQLLILKTTLANIGALDVYGKWNYEPNKDYLIIDGLKYAFEGDTSISQTKSNDLFFSVIVKREELSTGEPG